MKPKRILAALLTALASASLASAADTGAFAATPSNGLVFNFQRVPLGAVLNYLSEKTGLIVVSDVDITGSVSIVAKQPVATNEFVDFLNDQLAAKNYTAVLAGRTLTIMEAARAKTSPNTPVVVNHSGPAEIPLTARIVTEILPLQSLQAVQLVKDLSSLIPQGDMIAANESGNAVFMTAPEKDVHRVAEIIAALDNSSSSELKVFPLKFADAKSVASELKEIFQSADSEAVGAGSRNTLRGPGFPGGFGPGGPGDGGGNSSTLKTSQSRAVFVSDDQLNAIVASAPFSEMPLVSNVIDQLDRQVLGITQMRVFKLKHADPLEIVEELTGLFPSSSGSDENNRGPAFDFNPFGRQSSGDADKSVRVKSKSNVVAVADRRTESVIVTASQDLMIGIGAMIAALDESPRGVRHVSAIPIDHADAASVQQTITGLFSDQTASSTSTTTSALSARAAANNNNQSSSANSTSSGFQSGGSGTSAGR